MRAVNLLPRVEARTRPKLSAPLLAAGLVPVVVVGALVVTYSSASGDVTDKQAQLAAVKDELARTPPPVAVDPANTALAAEKNSRIGAISSALSGRVAFDRVLRELSLVLPEDVWLSSLSAVAPTAPASTEAAPPAAPPAGGSEGEGTAAPAASSSAAAATAAPNSPFVLMGFTYSQEGVARLLARLAVIPHLTNVRLGSSIRVPAGKRSVVQFAITADIRTPKEGS